MLEKTELKKEEKSFDELITEIVEQPSGLFDELLEHLISVEINALRRSFNKDPFEVVESLLKNNLDSRWRELVRAWVPKRLNSDYDYEMIEFVTLLYECNNKNFRKNVDWLIRENIIDQCYVDTFLEYSSDVEL